MKNIVLLLLLLPTICNSQNIFQRDIKWSTMKYMGGDCVDYFCASYYTKFGNDTTINEKVYRKVLNSTDSLQIEWKNTGFVREEGQKVFYRKNNDSIDYLLYDFDCKAGDTLRLDYWHYNPFFVVDSINYKVVMGISRKHIYISHVEHFGNEFWIEGIGSIRGILNSGKYHGLVGGFEQLLCCFIDSLQIYHDPDYENCYLTPSFVNSSLFNMNRVQETKLYQNSPNPFSSKTTIRFEIPQTVQKAQLHLCNMTGSLLKTINLNQRGAGNVMINANEFAAGMYLYSLIIDGRIVDTRQMLLTQ
jgi:hypothetical protein